MNTQRQSLITLLTILLTLFITPLAWATSASITVSGNEGAIPLNANATFSSYTYCDNATPPNCTTYNSGMLYVYQGTTLIGSASGNGSTSWSTTLDGGSMSQGDHMFTATAVDYEGTSHSSTTTITIDNTPMVTVNSPGLVEGEFDFGGTATFKEHVNGDEGTIYIHIDGTTWSHVHGYKSYEGTNIN